MKGHTFLFLGSLCALLTAPLRAQSAPDWISPAKRLTGYSDIARKESLERIRKMPDIEKWLLSAVKGEHKHLALDVIVALSFDRLVPDLLRASESDHDGATFLAISALLTEANENLVAEAFRRRVEAADAPPAAQMIMLDTLGRLGVTLPSTTLLRLVNGPSPEVRSAAVYFARARMLGEEKMRYLDVFRTAIDGHPFQLRLQAISAVRELRDSTTVPKDKALLSEIVDRACAKETSEEGRAACS